ncbi:DMT family transporter [Tenuibacillus multivorans]|uniref:EamA domain-containing membrane protein RarD n=1 Tax=Tenuibacillus multivorans TaxID=237069 RepID=A0A1H0BAM2_9BACI|nr:DMT family transporter [Tenuibacillus multivorans]GEL78765.1 membrane protein [Tenuibacillus multivorans]SDN42433.1 EamA domain-containing membrane protein RarD [Tenuibacillus multivorans]
MEQKQIMPYIAVIIGVLTVSTSAIFVRLADAPASIIANYRLVFAVILMLPLVLIKYRGEIAQISKKDWLFSIAAGIFLAFHFILWFESLNHTSVASSVVLVTTQPIWAFLGGYFFFKERFTSGAVISMIIALTGSVIISWGDFQISGMALFGNFLALMGAITITGYFLFGQNVRQRLSLITYTFVVYGMSAITLILYNLILKEPFVGYSTDTWLYFLALAIFPTFFGHTLFNWAIKWINASTITMGILFEPVGASILAYFILDEWVTWSQFLGGTIVIFGLILFIFSTSKKKKVKVIE